MEQTEVHLQDENTELDGAIGEVRTDIDALKRELENQKKDNYTQE